MTTDHPPDPKTTPPPSEAVILRIRERLRVNKPYTLRETILMLDSDALLRALDAATVEVAALKAELARRQSQHRIFERPPLVIEDDDGTPVGVGPTCPNGCDPTGRNIIFGAHSWFCAVCGVQLV